MFFSGVGRQPIEEPQYTSKVCSTSWKAPIFGKRSTKPDLTTIRVTVRVHTRTQEVLNVLFVYLLDNIYALYDSIYDTEFNFINL